MGGAGQNVTGNTVNTNGMGEVRGSVARLGQISCPIWQPSGGGRIDCIVELSDTAPQPMCVWLLLQHRNTHTH